MKAVAKTLDVARSNLIDRLQGRSKPRRGYRKAEDAELVPQIMALVTARPRLRLPLDHRAPEPAAAVRGRHASEPQTGLPDHEGP